LGTIHKKIIGIDGLRNEYFFHNTIPNKIIIKHPPKKINTTNNNNDNNINNNFSWTEINTEEEIKILLNSLSEKGIREQNLSNKIKKLLPKKLKLIQSNNNNNNNNNNNSIIISPEEKELEILNKLLNNNNKIINREDNNRNESRFLSEIFENLDEQISEYLQQDNKEWEEFITRADLKAFVNASDNEKEIAKCFILLNDRFKNPYKMNEFKNDYKITCDEDEYVKGGYVDSDMKIDLGYYDDNKILASKSIKK
jgi:hypothetical protein